ncbi:MAG: ABC transporter permease [Bacteroidia bacterium]|nr:ABC transporter permease [Bacteroidia bacterium]MBP9688014.1 ABC transporter permease [Bacteroidia bacterium]
MFRKISLVTQREFITRVRKKSFIIMTLAAPMLIVLFYGLIFYFAINKDIGATKKSIYVSDQSGNYLGKLKTSESMEFTYGYVEPGKQQQFLNDENYYALLDIPNTTPDSLKKVSLYSKDQAGLGTVMYIEKQLDTELKNTLLKNNGIDAETLQKINKTNITVKTIKVTDKGLESGNVGASTALGYIGAIMIYMFIFIYGVQIMRGVIEEKSNRIVEVIISSIKPFELMMGKILGIALVGLTQFTIWVLIVSIFGSGVSGAIMSNMGISPDAQQALTEGSQAASNSEIGDIIQALANFNFVYFIGMFLFYFIGGYLFYGALFAAIGSAVDNETDTQQFMLPITMPLIFALVIAQSAITANPNGALAFWLSVIPFTAPVVMMVRLPFDVPIWEVVTSMVCLVAGFIFTTWIAGRIYRIGILMYGKKPSYKLIAKWLFSKD